MYDSLLEYLSTPNGLNLSTVLSEAILTIVMIVVWIIVGILASNIVRVIVFRTMKVSKQEARALTVAKLLSSIMRYVIWFIVVLMILGELNIDITPFIASAGVIGLAIGFGAQEIVRDFISGFFIIFEGSFNVGDVVEIEGFKGNVKSLGLRTTIIENWLGEQKIINNGKIGSIINYSNNDSIAIIDFGVSYDTDLSSINELMEHFVSDTMKKYDVIIEVPQFLGVIELAESSINMRMLVKTKAMQHFQVERDVRRDLVEVLLKNKVEIPFPQVVVHNA